MANIHRLGIHSFADRELFAVEAASLEEIPIEIKLPSPHFVCFLAADFRSIPDESITVLAQTLLNAGCVYFACWGSNSTWVHDLIDLADVDLNPEGPWAITTSHEQESLTDALWEVLNVAWPDSEFEHDCASTLAISVGSADWATQIRSAFTNPAGFTSQVLKLEGGNA